MKRHIAAIAGTTVLMQALGLSGTSAADEGLLLAQRAEGGSVRQRLEENSYRNRHDYRPRRYVVPRNQLVDCHGDIRTHWIGGSLVTHRHIGDDCDIRIVNQGTSVPPPDFRD